MPELSGFLQNILDGNYTLVIGEILNLDKESEEIAKTKVMMTAVEAARESQSLLMAGYSAKASLLMANFTIAMGKIQQALKEARLGIKPEAIQQRELLEKLEKDFEEFTDE